MNNRIAQIREAEKKSHIDAYSSNVLFEKGSWLSKPIKTVVYLFPFFEGRDEFRGLDLGCGVGRNCIPLAQSLSNIDCNIDCVDILDMAISSLEKYSADYNVEACINGIVQPIEQFRIKADYYDLVLGISSLEYVENEELFFDMLNNIKNGVLKNGIV